MPISFEAPGPIGAIVGINRFGNGQGLADQYAAEMQAKNGAAQQNATRMQQDRQAANAQMQQRDQFVAQNAYSPRDQGQAQSQMALQQQHAQLQSQLQQEDFNHSDSVRLSQLQQAKNDILQQETDHQISPVERDQMLLQLHTGERGISVLNLRKQQTEEKYQQQHIQQVQQAMDVQMKAEQRKVAADEDSRDFQSAKIKGQIKEIPHEYKVKELADQIQRDLPELSPDQVRKEAEEQAVKGGHFSTWFKNDKGVLMHAKDVDAAKHGGMVGPDGEPVASGTRSKSGGGAAVAKEFDTMKARSQANSEAHKMATEGHIGKDEIAAKSQEIYDQFKKDHTDHLAEGQQGKLAHKAAPFDVNNPESGTPQQRKSLVPLGKTQAEIANRHDLPDATRMQAQRGLQTSIRLQAKYALPNGQLAPETPDHVVKELNRIDAFIKSIPAEGSVRPDPASVIPANRHAAFEERVKAMGGSVSEGGQAPPAGPPPEEVGGTGPPPNRSLQRDAANLKKKIAGGAIDTARGAAQRIESYSGRQGKRAGENLRDAWDYLSGY